MFEKVLLPTDFSEYARKTMEYLQEIPGIKEVILLHVSEEVRSDGKAWIAGHDEQSPSDRAWKTLQAEREFLEAKSIPTRIKIESAEREDIARAILEYAEKEEISLIMMGARGKGIIGGFLLGSVSSQVLRNAKSHVLITQYGPIQKKGIIKRGGSSIERYPGPLFRRVLIPVDFSRVSTEVIEFARDIEGIEEIILLHVISRAESSRELETQMKDTYKRLQYLSSKIDLGDIPVKIYIRFGSPAEEICTMADDEGATMIMVSRFGETGEVENILIGDTVLEVAKSAKRPVFVRYPIMSPVVMARELQSSEFSMAEEIWTHYRQLRTDFRTDRIFGVFLGDILVCAARCRRYPEGLAVDGVYTLDEFRGRGYATKVMDALVASCGTETLYMFSPQNLVEFYKLYGFMPGGPMDIPQSIREAVILHSEERELETLKPMKREPGLLERV